MNAPFASTYAGDEPTARWEFAPEATIDLSAHYLVKTNGMEWRDIDLRVMKGYEVAQKLKPEYIRGRPVLIARITEVGLDGLVQNR